MQVVTKQISVMIDKDEQSNLYNLVDKVSATYVCELINCGGCTSEVCDKNICPFYTLDNELRAVMDKIFEAAKEYGPKEKQ